MKIREDSVEETWYQNKNGNFVCEQLSDSGMAVFETFNKNSQMVSRKTIDLTKKVKAKKLTLKA